MISQQPSVSLSSSFILYHYIEFRGSAETDAALSPKQSTPRTSLHPVIRYFCTFQAAGFESQSFEISAKRQCSGDHHKTCKAASRKKTIKLQC
jgi:hypothetical protein